MTAARTKQEDKDTGIIRVEKKNRQEGGKHENCVPQGVDSKKTSRLCYKDEPDTLPPELPSSS